MSTGQFFITIKADNITIAEKIRTFSDEDRIKVAEEILIEIAENRGFIARYLSWAIFEEIDSNIPIAKSSNYKG